MVWARDPRHEPNLDEILRQLGLGVNPDNLPFWAAIFELPQPGWEPREIIVKRGTGWIAILDHDEHSYVKIDDETHSPVDVRVRPPSMLLGVRLPEFSADALSQARSRLRALIGAVSTRMDANLLGSRVYENFVEVTPAGRVRYAACRLGISWRSDKADLDGRLTDLTTLTFETSPAYATRGAEWLGRAIEQEGFESKFTCLWLAILTIIEGWSATNLAPPTGKDVQCCTSSGDWPMRRKMREYIERQMQLGTEEGRKFFDRLDGCYELRHRLFKGGSAGVIEEQQLIEAARVATELVYRELGLG